MVMAQFDEFITSLRQEFGEQDAGFKFEVFCKWFLENDPEWSRTVDKVWLWDDYPNKWQRQDLGGKRLTSAPILFNVIIEKRVCL
jgi:predicted helicase